MKLKLNGTHQLLGYTYNVILQGGNIYSYTIKKNTETLIDASKEVGLEINLEKFSLVLEYKSKPRYIILLWFCIGVKLGL
jgi:hypothetical protein